MKGIVKNASLIPVESWDTMQWIKDKFHSRDMLDPMDKFHNKNSLHPEDHEWILVLVSPVCTPGSHTLAGITWEMPLSLTQLGFTGTSQAS